MTNVPVDFSVTSVNESHLRSHTSFETVDIPSSPINIEIEIRCHGCHQPFKRTMSCDFKEEWLFYTRQECPHCTADLTYKLEVSQEARGLDCHLTVVGETHLRHQTPGDVAIELVSITAGAPQPVSERVLQMARQKGEPPLDLLESLEDV